MSIRWLTSVALFIAMLSGVVASVSCSSPHPSDHPAEVAEIAGPTFPIRVSALPEQDGGFVAGRYYRFESLPDGSKNWVRAMQFRHDDPVPIPRQNIKFVTSKIAFVFMGWQYAVTTDGGARWDAWSAEKNLPGWRCCNYGLIKEVTISQTGNGKMILDPIQDRAGEVHDLITSDFGRHWFPTQSRE